MDKKRIDKNMQWKFVAMENNRLGLDDNLPFACDNCGECCRKQEDLIMNPYDIFRMAKQMEITPEEWIDLYGRCHIGDDSKLPIVRIRLIGSTNRCPFLKNNRCSLHQIKPDVCATFPIGRAVCYVADTCGRKKEQPEVIYFHSGCQCGSNKSKQTVGEWLDEFGLRDRESFFIRWSQIIKDTSMFMRKLVEQTEDEKTVHIVLNMVLTLFYVNYDIKRDFNSQFEKNMQELKKHMTVIETLGGGLS